MSRGISWRQRFMLGQLLRMEEADKEGMGRVLKRVRPVAWMKLDYGPTRHNTDDENAPRHHWNKEQAMRRALRNLEQRGLVKLGRYVFLPYAEHWRGALSPEIAWLYQHSNEHIPGQSRFMTGVLLTDEGRRVAREWLDEIVKNTE